MTVSRFDDGNRHDVYKVAYAAEGGTVRYLVVRVSLVDDPTERAQAAREAKVLETVGGLAAPRLCDVSLTSPWFDAPSMSMGFVPGHHLSLGQVAPPQIERLGVVVASVHTEPVDGLADQLGEAGDLESYAASRLRTTLAGLGWVREPVAADVRRRLQSAAARVAEDWERRRHTEPFNSDETLVLLHGDIAFDNVVWGPDPVLLDWEYARLGDPADEIAYLFDQSGLTAALRARFWRGYRTRSRNEAHVVHIIERAAWWEPTTLLGSTLWWVERFVRRAEAAASDTLDRSVPRDPAYYLDQAVGRLDRLDTLLRRPPAA